MRTTRQSTGLSYEMSAALAALVALTALATPVSLPAQHRLTAVQIEGRRSVRDNARADTLEAKAVALYGRPRQWSNAARLHRRAAELRRDDPRAIQSWRSAALVFSAAQDHATGLTLMEHAADKALASGDLEQAALSYIDAAFFAVAIRQDRRVSDLLRRSRMLVNAPLFPAEQRTILLQRIEGQPRLAQAWGTP
jgi:hypothetical protein